MQSLLDCQGECRTEGCRTEGCDEAQDVRLCSITIQDSRTVLILHEARSPVAQFNSSRAYTSFWPVNAASSGKICCDACHLKRH